MTHVLTTQELQNKIPETRSLDGNSFSDLKILLTEVIKYTEASGMWQFVQYLPGKPSLFIVRQLATQVNKLVDDRQPEKFISGLKEKVTDMMPERLKPSNYTYSPKSEEDTTSKTFVEKDNGDKTLNKMPDKNPPESKLFNEINLPWK